MLHNVLEGYALIDDYVARGVDLFDLQQLNLMLEINATVSRGSDPTRRLEYAQHLAATEEHFFNNASRAASRTCTTGTARTAVNRSGSVRPGCTYASSASRSCSSKATTAAVRCIVSYLLMRAGLPPFVLSLENAEGYFNPSSVIRNSAKHGVKALYELPKIKKNTQPSSKNRHRIQ